MQWIDTTFMRGGTSKGLFFRDQDLPAPGPDRDQVFLLALGSPDPFGRQLDGMGGGLSSLSKVVSVAVSNRPDTDLEYTFGQVAVDAPLVDYSGNCGNLSSAVVPYALESGLLRLADGPQTVSVFNTNTAKQIRVHLQVRQGVAAVAGDLIVPGVAATGAPIELEYLQPGGARTGTLLPTATVRETLIWEGQGYETSLIDAANPTVFVRAKDLGILGDELPDQLDADAALQARLEGIRRAGAVAMGMAHNPESAPQAVPKIALVAEPRISKLLDGTTIDSASCDLTMRVISMGQTHRATPGTTALCAAVAAQIPDSIVHTVLPDDINPQALRIATPSGVVTAGANVNRSAGGQPTAESASLYRTARPLMRGQVALPMEISTTAA
ncbi:2-methylaconitate cis-trans isomerase PrpF family protein [Arthrobacter sp. Marseille-P9274]|uniref:2-methylaconitate cis-trans isomerase PrpF family protein n=1 Tax=Arthrobacter sp. Marseille-P9274 TaxID=2866572 RepID=UPI0021CA0C9D|nr:PrpF domain-containing protein [Arthrobacter sp. Marseille-P9274]